MTPMFEEVFPFVALPLASSIASIEGQISEIKEEVVLTGLCFFGGSNPGLCPGLTLGSPSGTVGCVFISRVKRCAG